MEKYLFPSEKITEKPINLVGKITWVQTKRHKRNKDREVFEAINSKNEKKIKCICSFYCPIKKGDIIVAKILPKDDYYIVIKPPFVQVGNDKEAISTFFRKNLKGFGEKKSEKLYDEIELLSGPGKVDKYLSELADMWVNNEDDALLQEFSEYIESGSLSLLLTRWYHVFDKRRLWLLGLTNAEIGESLKMCGSYYKIYELCLDNPFKVYPVPENKCMEIMNRLQKCPEEVDIQCGKIIRKIYENMIRRSWVCTPIKFLAKEFKQLKDLGPKLVSDYGISKDFECVYIDYPYRIERYVCEYIKKLVLSDTIRDNSTEFVNFENWDPLSYNNSRLEAEFRESATLSPDQCKAVQGALDHKISIIRGGPGTGKSSSVKEIVYNLRQRNVEYAICAFTGKAVARLRVILDSTIPMTFHLKMKKQKSAKFQHLIVDEASMVTIELFYNFITRFNFPFNITLIGDPDQLPPIGWGSLFTECIKSGTVPTYELTINHRVYHVSDEEDGIISNTRRMSEYGKGIQKGKLLTPMKFEPTSNFVISRGNIDHISAFAKAFKSQGVKPRDITVITPYNKDIDSINKAFQQLYYHDNDENDVECVFDSRGIKWYVGDRVMMIKNDYDINVMNGEEGEVIEVDSKDIKVRFGYGREYDFPLEPDPKKRRWGTSYEKKDDEDDTEEERTVRRLIHSYCVTVHRGQGSEWNYIIFYLPPGRSQPSYITKNLVYTGLTRAKRALFFIGNIKELEESTIRSLPFRCENLSKRLVEKLDIWNSPEPIDENEGFEEDYDL